MKKSLDRDSNDLTSQQRKFIQEYMIDENKARAYKKAYGFPDLDDVEAAARGNNIRKNPKVRHVIESTYEEDAFRNEISRDAVLQELKNIAFANPKSVMKWGPAGVVLKDSDTLSDEEASLVGEVSETKDGIKIKLHDKLSALEKLGKHLKLFNDTVDINMTIGIGQRLDEARRLYNEHNPEGLIDQKDIPDAEIVEDNFDDII